jgi:molybdopterin-guanine dinucleotide biosynthesis protein A
MGRPKAELPHSDGGTYLCHAIEQLVASCQHVACSVAASGSSLIKEIPSEISGGLEILADSLLDRGPAEGVARAMQYADTLHCTGVMVTPVDLPNLDARHLTSLAEVFKQHPRTIVVARSADPLASKPLQPLVAIYPIHLQGELEALTHSDQRSLYRFIESHEHLAVELPAVILHNVNSPHDLLS